VASHHDTDRERLVVKSGAAVSALLRHAGAVRAADEFDDRRDRRELRNRATRLSNADAANVRRSVEAAQDQLQDIERAVARVGWAGLGEDLRALALTRLVNPEASLAELAALCDPPASKSAVHRRMARIAAIARGQA
jgi:cell division protein WhiA